jgi:hypothetical protein
VTLITIGKEMWQNPLTNDLATHSEQPFLDIDNIRAKLFSTALYFYDFAGKSGLSSDLESFN